MKKYNFSFKRIVTRFLLTFVIGIIFGICMFPFMRVAEGLLFEQKAAIGGENMWRAVLLWGLYTTIVTLITFWKKRFRMVSVLLILCWLISVVFLGFVLIKDKSSLDCKRSNPYTLDSEFIRSLDLIAQRLEIDKINYGYFSLAFNYLNCLDIQYSNTVSENDAEGLFLTNESDWQQMKIRINPEYKQFDDLSIATILIHELSHVGQAVNHNTPNSQNISALLYDSTTSDCFSQEAEAFTEQLKFFSKLNQEETRSIYTRLRDNISLNPAFSIVLMLQDINTAAINSCSKLKKENSLTEQQLNDCVWVGVKNNVEKVVREDKFYQEQCNTSK